MMSNTYNILNDQGELICFHGSQKLLILLYRVDCTEINHTRGCVH